jgi:hypothetical protein
MLYRLTLRPLPDAVPVEHRLRRLLKWALRAGRLRCLTVEALPEGHPPAAAPPDSPGDDARQRGRG